MKKTLLLTLAMGLLSLSQSAFAQNERYRTNLSLGSGVNICSFADIQDSNFVGLSSSFTYQKMWKKWFGYRIGVQYDQKGNREYSVYTSGDNGPFNDGYHATNVTFGDLVERQTKLEYLTIPLSLEFNLQIRKFGFFGFGGGYAAYLLRQTYGYKSYSAEDYDYDKAQIIKMLPFDLGITFGSGTSYAITKRLSTRAEAVFQYGMIPIGKRDKGKNFTKCITAQASFVYSLNTKKDKEKLGL